MKHLVCISLFTFILPTLCCAQDQHEHPTKISTHEDISHDAEKQIKGVEALSQDLRSLLIEEMQALQTGMMSIIPEYVSGNWSAIENTANKMNESYILKQNLSESQMHELHSVLPQEFIEKDQRFHYLAGMLEHAAENKKPELINFYFSELTRSCVSCHTQFAIHKFPALNSNVKKQEHSH